jgi:hypothetical protein
MPNPEVIAKVRELRSALDETRPDHPAVAAVSEQLDRVLAQPTHAAHYTGLRDKLLAVEVDHPKTTAALQALVQSLNAAGI